MSANILIFLLFIGVWFVVMFARHRGGQSHGMGMGCCGGHGHGSPDEHAAGHQSHEPSEDSLDDPIGRREGEESARSGRHGDF